MIHIFWTPGSTQDRNRRVDETANHLNRKVETALRSALRTQTDARIILWTHVQHFERLNEQTRALRELRCRSGSTMEVRSTEELSKLSIASNDPLLKMCAPNLSGKLDHKVSYSDLLRFVALYFFGGLYVDSDTVFLRDMRDLHGQSFAFKWDFTVQYYNTAIMGLPKSSPLVPQIIKHTKVCSAEGFYPISIKDALNCTIGVCQGLIMMPTLLFNPSQSSQTEWQWQNVDGIKHNRDVGTHWFFDRPRLWELDNFFPGSYTFHWHNRWMHPVHNESFFADLERLNAECTSVSAPLSLFAMQAPAHTILAGAPQAQSTPCILPATPPSAKVCRKVYIDLGGYTGDTLETYGNAFLRAPSASGLNLTWEAYVFEVDYGHLRTIIKKLDGPLAYLKPYTQVLNVAVWNQDTVLKFTVTGHKDGKVSDGGGQQVLAYDIGTWFMRTIHPVECDDILVKMDIDGAEVEAIQSLSAAGALPFVDHLAVKLHTWNTPRVDKEKPALDKLLEKGGIYYNYATLDDKLDVHYKIGQPWPVNHCDSHYLRSKPT